MTLDFKRLAPHRPLDPGDPAYVPQADRGGLMIAKWLRAGASTLLVGGPTGVGKSTEMAQAASTLSTDRVVGFVPAHRLGNIRQLGPEVIWVALAEALLFQAKLGLALRLSDGLMMQAYAIGIRDESLVQSAPKMRHAHRVVPPHPADLLNAVIHEIQRSSGLQVALLIDGLERLAEGEQAREIFEALGHLSDDVGLATVVPWHSAFGPGADLVVRPGERLVSIPSILPNPEGVRFLAEILRRRLELSNLPFDDRFLSHAARMSGGVPRTYLQLVADAATYARLNRNDEWPDINDLIAAVNDQRESFRRVLLPGDKQFLDQIKGRSGQEFELSRRIRLLAHGALLERRRGTGTVLEPHPLAV